MTSHDVVATIRRTLGTRRVGHGGTLDPDATGVLVVGVGRATRLLGHLSGQDKEYRAVIRLGSTTSTDDAAGERITVCDPTALAAVGEAEVRSAASRLTGTISQRPPAVSAVKVAGRRAYARARSGEVVVLEPRTVTVLRLDIHSMDRGDAHLDVTATVVCTAGTYVRSLPGTWVPRWGREATSSRCNAPGPVPSAWTRHRPSTGSQQTRCCFRSPWSPDGRCRSVRWTSAMHCGWRTARF